MRHPNDDQNSIPFGDSPVGLRRDLQFATIRRGLHVTHVVKDPVNLKYFEFDEHEFELLRQMDEGKSGDELCLWFNRRYPPLRLTPQALHAMVWRLYQQGLLVTLAVGQGRKVAERALKARRKESIQRLSQPWVIRLPGFNPGPWLERVNCVFGGLFSPVFVGLASIGLVLVLGLIFAQYGAIARMRSGSVDFFSRENLTIFAFVIIVTKLLHEMGHALAAHRLGCECHEMGILLLAGLPSLYCDVSDAWILPNRWHRIAVSLAGIWVEILIAAVAFVVWMASVPGIVHSISLNVMVVCSAGTLLFNANPLVRYDGYYVLMDIAGISNLAQRSNEAVVRLFNRSVLGSHEARSLESPEISRWCLLYGVAAAIYRVFLTCAILWGLHLALKPFSLSIFVWLFAAIGLIFWGIKMLKTTGQHVRRTLRTGTPRWRVIVGLTMFVGVIAAATEIPLPWYVFGDAVLEPIDRQTLVMTVPGQLKQHLGAGSSIESGEIVARFDNRDIEQEFQRMEGELRSQGQHLQALRARRNQDLRAAEQIPGAEAAVAALEHRLQFLSDERRRLELRAGETSVIYPAPIRNENLPRGELGGWTGSLLDSANRDAWVGAGDVYCQMGNVNRLEAIAILAQDDLESVAVGQRADLLLKSSGKTVRGQIAKISNLELDSKDESTVGATLPREADSQGRGKLHGKWYQVQIRCDATLPEGTIVRSRGKVRIHVGSRTVGKWIAWQFFKTFRWHA